jgi:hypothetical protein
MRNLAYALTVFFLALGLAGCRVARDGKEPPMDPKADIPPQTAELEMPDDEIHKGVKTAEGSADLAKLKDAMAKAKTEWSKSKDDKSKAGFVKATVELATATMNSPELAPREKYPQALKLYKEALALDPDNKEALENKKMIEDIYKSMGREVPT